MKFGMRECVDVVLRARAKMKIGNKTFFKNEPVLYFDSLKTSTLEGASTTVYAQGGRGNVRRISWDGERTLTFTMEDALISPIGLSILTGAGLIDGSADKPIIMHATATLTVPSTVDWSTGIDFSPEGGVYASSNGEDCIYVMGLDENGDVMTEPFIATYATGKLKIDDIAKTPRSAAYAPVEGDLAKLAGKVILVDFYQSHANGAIQIDITEEISGKNFYLEGSTLWRDEATGVDMPAEIIIPNCHVQSNFSFAMASSGDPSTFTYTMDAFPGFTRWDATKKVLCSIQYLRTDEGDADGIRTATVQSA